MIWFPHWHRLPFSRRSFCLFFLFLHRAQRKMKKTFYQSIVFVVVVFSCMVTNLHSGRTTLQQSKVPHVRILVSLPESVVVFLAFRTLLFCPRHTRTHTLPSCFLPFLLFCSFFFVIATAAFSIPNQVVCVVFFLLLLFCLYTNLNAYIGWVRSRSSLGRASGRCSRSARSGHSAPATSATGAAASTSLHA